MVYRSRCGLDEENVHSANIFANLKVSFTVRERLNSHFPERAPQSKANLLGQRAVRSAAKYLEIGEQGSGWFRGRHRRLIGISEATGVRNPTQGSVPELTVQPPIDKMGRKRSTGREFLSCRFRLKSRFKDPKNGRATASHKHGFSACTAKLTHHRGDLSMGLENRFFKVVGE